MPTMRRRRRAGRWAEFFALSQLCRRAWLHHRLWLPGSGTQQRPGPLLQPAWIIGTTGELFYNHRKRLLYDADKTLASPGRHAHPLVARPFGSLTAGICGHGPKRRRLHRLLCSAPRLESSRFAPTGRKRATPICTSTGAIGCSTFPATLSPPTPMAMSCPGHDFTSFAGQSAIFDPGGRLLASAPRQWCDVVLTAQLIPRQRTARSIPLRASRAQRNRRSGISLRLFVGQDFEPPTPCPEPGATRLRYAPPSAKQVVISTGFGPPLSTIFPGGTLKALPTCGVLKVDPARSVVENASR